MTNDPGRIERRLGGPPVTVTVAGVAWPEGLVAHYRATHGRPSAEERVAPAVLSLSLVARDPARRPRVGDTVTVDLTDTALAHFSLDPLTTGARRRFTGRVTSSSFGYVSGEPLVQLTATGTKARLGRLYIGDTPWAAEAVEARVSRILALCQAQDSSLELGPVEEHTDPALGWVLEARDVDRRPALELLDAMAEDTMGELVELRDGRLSWHGLEHRRAAGLAPVELAADDVLADTAWAEELDGLANAWALDPRLELAEGEPDPYAGAQLEHDDPDSIAKHGAYPVTRTTELTSPHTPPEVPDAWRTLLRVGLARHSRPRWELPALRLELLAHDETTGAGVTPAQAGQLLEREHGDLIKLVGLPSSAPTTHGHQWVEGWTEELTRHTWRLELAVTQRGHTGPPIRWVDDVTATWADAAGRPGDPGPVWLETGAWWPEGDSLGRWLDEFADTTWESTALELERDQWQERTGA